MTQLPDWMQSAQPHNRERTDQRGASGDTTARPQDTIARSPAEEQTLHNRPPWWSEAQRLLDQMPVREIADHLGIRVGQLNAEIRKGVRFPSPDRRSGSKDTRIESCFHLLGQIPDADVARRADVSVRTVASYRARHGIAGYDGPRRRPEPREGRRSRLEDMHEILGRVPDRVVADEAGMSLGAVRNYRIKHSIEAVGRMTRREIDVALRSWHRKHTPEAAAPAAEPPRSEATARMAWQISIEGGAGGIIVARDVREAIELAIEAAGGDANKVSGLERVGPLLAPETGR
jgi:hypothetical protein